MSKRILLIGEKAVDVWVAGTCDRISPEEPVLIHKPTSVETNDGMAANVKANIVKLSPGTRVDFYHQTKEIYKIRHIDSVSGRHLLRVDDGDDAFEPEFWQKVIIGMAANKEGYKAIVVSDYNKGLVSTKMMEALAEIANELGVPFFVDTKAILGEWSKKIDFIKINEKEYKAQLSAGVIHPWEWCRNLIVTKGKDGADLYTWDGKTISMQHFKAYPAKTWSVAGAGDSVCAALVVRYLETNGDIIESINFAMKVAAIAISQPGVVAVSRKEVDELK